MSLLVIGTNHKYSPIELRERISFSKKRLKEALFFLKQKSILKGAVILSTCNRVEVYASAEEHELGIREIEDFISRYHEIEKRRISPYLYRYIDKEAMEHLFSVASGIDSLILGETQILGQVKFSFLETENVNFTDELLRKVFYSAISFAKRMHTETKISEGKVSVGSVAVDFIKKRINNLSDKSILIIGVGKVTELFLKYLKKEKPNVVFVSNRTFEKAKELAAQIEAKAVRFDRLKQFLKEADVVIAATTSPHFVIKKEMLEEIINRKLLIIDLALPRDIDPQVKEIKDVDLFCLEDLDIAITRNKERKIKEAKKIEEIIHMEIEKLWEEIIELEQEPAILP